MNLKTLAKLLMISVALIALASPPQIIAGGPLPVPIPTDPAPTPPSSGGGAGPTGGGGW